MTDINQIPDAPDGELTTLTGNEKVPAISGAGASVYFLISRILAFIFGGNVNFNSHKATNLADPTSAQDAATKTYVDSKLANVGKRSRVRAATTANITISTALNNGDALDGVSLATGDLVLVKNQSTAAQNGIYVVGITPARFEEFDTYDEHPGSLIAIEEGTTNADTLWLCTSNVGGTLDTTAINFSTFTFTATITVQDEDGTPLVTGVDTIKFTNGTVTDNGDGSVSVDVSGTGGGGAALENLARGIAYSVSGSPSGSFPDVDLYSSDGSADFSVKGGKLNDGKKASRVFNSGEYLGWNSANPAITFDMGAAVDVSEIIIFGLTDTGSGIYQPSEVKIEHSDDNSSWTTDVDKSSLSAGSGIHSWEFDYRFGSPSSHRYWKITVTRQTDSLFISEIEILGTR